LVLSIQAKTKDLDCQRRKSLPLSSPVPNFRNPKFGKYSVVFIIMGKFSQLLSLSMETF